MTSNVIMSCGAQCEALSISRGHDVQYHPTYRVPHGVERPGAGASSALAVQQNSATEEVANLVSFARLVAM